MTQNAPDFSELLGSARHTAVHLEMRDVYSVGEEVGTFNRFLSTGEADLDPQSPLWLGWTPIAREAVGRGVVMRRARIVSEPVTDYIRYGDLRSLDLTDAQLITGRISGIHAKRVEFESLNLHGVEITGSDLGSARWSDSKLTRVMIRDCKLMGAALDGLVLDDVLFEGCKFDHATFEKVRATGPVAFAGCVLTEATFTDCDLSDVVFSECTLRLTEFGTGRYRDADLRGNDLSAVRGVASLAKVRITPAQQVDLAVALVADLDIDVSDDWPEAPVPLHLAFNDLDALHERCDMAAVRTTKDEPEYEEGAVVPSGPWQSLTEEAGRSLEAPQWAPHCTLAEVVRPPLPDEDDLERLADHLGDENAHYLGQALARPGMTTTTENYAAGLLLGLHLDNWDKLIHGAKARGRRRLALNLGPGTRYVILGAVDAQAVCRAVHPDDHALRYPHTNDYRAHVAAGHPGRLIRIRLAPGEGYIAPTEYLLHDGSTEGQDEPSAMAFWLGH